MKRILALLITLILTINLSYGFDILGNNDEQKTYFSLLDHSVKVRTSQNLPGLTIEKTGVNSSQQFYNLTSCEDKFCYDFSLISYISEKSLTLESSQFDITIGTETKSIYLDVEEPSFSIENSVVDNETRELKLYFTYSDNYAVKSIDVYEIDGNSQINLGNITSNTFTHNLSESGNLSLKFTVNDMAGNSKEFNYDFEISDLFGPTIDNLFLVKENAVFNLNFKVSDLNLSRYEIIQNDIKLTEILSGTMQEKSVTIPFSEGKILFRAYDKNENYVEKEINLDTSIKNTYQNKFSRYKEFQFKSDADICVLTKQDTTDKNDKFSKSGNDFSLILSISRVQNYPLTFYCENENIREYFTRDFYYDTNKPQETSLELEVLEDGDLKLSWEETFDSESSIEYILYRDSDKIYEGTREYYKDDSVSYPNEYEYYLKVIDEAGNYVETEEISGIPQKVDVELFTNLKYEETSDSEKLSFKITSEEGASIDLTVKNLGKVIYQKDYSGKENNVELTLVDGVNEITVKSKDSLGNEKSVTSFITYNKPVVVVTEPEVVAKEEVVTSTPPTVVIPEPVISEPEVIEEPVTEISFYYWMAFWLIILVLFVWYFVFNESDLRKKLSTIDVKKSNNKLVKKSAHHNEYSVRRRNDQMLNKSLEKAKKERIAKHNARVQAEKIAKEKSKRELSDMEKAKLSDLSNRNKFDFKPKTNTQPKEQKTKTPELVSKEKMKEEVKEKFDDAQEVTKKSKSVKKKGFLEGILNSFKKKEPEQEDHFESYLSKQKRNPAWESTHLYRQSHYDKIAAAKAQKQKEIEEQKRAELNAKQEEIDKARKIAEKKARKKQEKEEFKQARKIATAGLDEYLEKRNKRRRFIFAEKAVESDLKTRQKK